MKRDEKIAPSFFATCQCNSNPAEVTVCTNYVDNTQSRDLLAAITVGLIEGAPATRQGIILLCWHTQAGRMGVISNSKYIHVLGRKLFLQNAMEKCLWQCGKRGKNWFYFLWVAHCSPKNSFPLCVTEILTQCRSVGEASVTKSTVSTMRRPSEQPASLALDRRHVEHVGGARTWRAFKILERSVPGRYRLFALCAVPANMPQGIRNRYEAKMLRHVGC